MDKKSKPTWLIESHVGDEPGFQAMLTHLRGAAYPHHVMRFVPFSYDVVGDAPDVSGPCIAFGGAGIAEYVKQKDLRPGIWTSDDFSPANYARNLGPLYLNHLQRLCRLSEVTAYASSQGWDHFFLRPDNDLKSFAGRIFSLGEVETWVRQLRDGDLLETHNYQVAVSPLMDVGREWRTVVVNGEPIAWSQYRQDGRRKDHRSITPEALTTIKQAVALFSPADVFVADVCETSAGMKIVEYNTFNSAGLYACDIGHVIDVVSDFVLRKMVP
jgi:hypothetical protein